MGIVWVLALQLLEDWTIDSIHVNEKQLNVSELSKRFSFYLSKLMTPWTLSSHFEKASRRTISGSSSIVLKHIIMAKLSKFIGADPSSIICWITSSETSIPMVLNVPRKSLAHINPSLFRSKRLKHWFGRFSSILFHWIFHKFSRFSPPSTRAVWFHPNLECQMNHLD